jgi:hypothetical protein
MPSVLRQKSLYIHDVREKEETRPQDEVINKGCQSQLPEPYGKRRERTKVEGKVMRRMGITCAFKQRVRAGRAGPSSQIA